MTDTVDYRLVFSAVLPAVRSQQSAPIFDSASSANASRDEGQRRLTVEVGCPERGKCGVARPLSGARPLTPAEPAGLGKSRERARGLHGTRPASRQLMAQYGTYEPPPQIPKRRMPWFTKLLFAFALLMVILVIYGFVRAQPSPLPDERTWWEGPEPYRPSALSVVNVAYA